MTLIYFKIQKPFKLNLLGFNTFILLTFQTKKFNENQQNPKNGSVIIRARQESFRPLGNVISVKDSENLKTLEEQSDNALNSSKFDNSKEGNLNLKQDLNCKSSLSPLILLYNNEKLVLSDIYKNQHISKNGKCIYYKYDRTLSLSIDEDLREILLIKYSGDPINQKTFIFQYPDSYKFSHLESIKTFTLSYFDYQPETQDELLSISKSTDQIQNTMFDPLSRHDEICSSGVQDNQTSRILETNPEISSTSTKTRYN